MPIRRSRSWLMRPEAIIGSAQDLCTLSFRFACPEESRGGVGRWRIDALAEAPFVIRGLSCEPLFEELDLREHLAAGLIHWVIAGGESGSGARPTDLAWYRSLQEQCREAGAAFFLKQAITNQKRKE